MINLHWYNCEYKTLYTMHALASAEDWAVKQDTQRWIPVYSGIRE